MTIQKFLEKICQVLEELKIDYAVTGGVAVSFYGRPRYTADLDIIIKISDSEKLSYLTASLLKKIKKSYLDQRAALDALKRKSEFNFIETGDGWKADFFIVSNDKYQQEEIRRARKVRTAGKIVKFISPEDLIISKLKWYKEGQSARQIEDIASILEAGNLDKKYLNLWIKKLGLEDEWREVGEVMKQ